MNVLLVSEGEHELRGALEALVRKLVLQPVECDPKKVTDREFRVHPGKGRGFFKKALRCMQWAKEHQYEGVVLVVDRDGDTSRSRQFDEAQESPLPEIRRALGVAVETFDAWMLADEQALSYVLGSTIQRLPDPEGMKEPKAVCTNLRDAARLSLGLADLYHVLAGAIQVAVLENRCPQGFGVFAQRVRQLNG